MKNLRSYFITGAIAIFPLFLTIYILIRLVKMSFRIVKNFVPVEKIVDCILGSGMNELVNNFLSINIMIQNVLITFFTYVFTFVLIYVLVLIIGIFVKHFINKEKVKYLEGFILKIPLAKPIYTTIKQISTVIFIENSNSYKKVVLVEYPKKDIYSIGFLTNEKNSYMNVYFPDKEILNIFVPTSPNPTSGMFIMMEKDKVVELDMSIEDAVKLIISGGVIIPERKGR